MHKILGTGLILLATLAVELGAVDIDADGNAILIQMRTMPPESELWRNPPVYYGSVETRLAAGVADIRDKAREALTAYPATDLVVVPEYALYPPETVTDANWTIRLAPAGDGTFALQSGSNPALAAAVADCAALASELRVWMFLGTVPLRMDINTAQFPNLPATATLNTQLIIDPAGRIVDFDLKVSGSDCITPWPSTAEAFSDWERLANQTSVVRVLTTRAGWPFRYLTQICAERMSPSMLSTNAGARADLLIETSAEGDGVLEQFATFVQANPYDHTHWKQGYFDTCYYNPQVVANGRMRGDGVFLLADAVGPDAAGVRLDQGSLRVLNIFGSRWTAVGWTLRIAVPQATIVAVDAVASEPGDNGSFRIQLSPAPLVPTTVTLAVSGSAGNGSDYTALPASVTFAAGETQRDLAVAVLDDGAVEGDETVQIGLLSAVGAVLSGSPVTIALHDNDVAAPAGTLAFSATTYSQAEGNSGTATVTITATRSGGSNGAVGVSYATANGTATAGSDYTATSGTLSWANGDTANKTFTVTISGDATVESGETVALSLSSVTGGASLGTSSATLTITNDDVAPAGTLAFSATTYSQAEGNSGTATVTITATRSGGSNGAVGVSYATANGTATAGSDYTATSGTLSWANGDTANKTFTVSVAGDTTFESGETVLLSLSGPTGGAGLGTSSATLTITNDDAAPVAPVITTQPANQTVTAPATATFSVVASGTPTPTYQWQSAPSGSSTFTAISGATSASYTTAATATAMSGMKYRCVVTNSAGTATSNQATLTVTAAPAPVAAIAVGDPVCSETGPNPGTFIISLSNAAADAVTVGYARSGRANNGSDFVTIPMAVTIPAGQTTATVTVTPIDDTKYEKAEAVILTLTTGAGYTVGTPSSATLSIQDNDGINQTSPVVATSSAPTAGSAVIYTAPTNADWPTDLIATWSWSDGTPDSVIAGALSADHTYTTAGIYTLTVTISDPANSATLVESFSVTVVSRGGGGGGGSSGGGSGGCGVGSGLSGMGLILALLFQPMAARRRRC